MPIFRARSLKNRLLLIAVFFAAADTHAAEFSDGLDGDIGVGGYYSRAIIRGKSDQFSVLPYGSFDDGRLFARIDTFGVKTLALGYGYVEISGRFSQDGFYADVPNLRGLHDRQGSLPLGVGTLQITPVGAFFLNAFHDVHQSNGNLFEVIYAAEFGTPDLMIYPLAGAEYQSAQYTRYFYGISAQESAASRYAAYQPGGSFNPMLGGMLDVKLTEKYHLNFYARRKWLGNAIQSSPIVSASTLDTAFIALSYRFP